MSLKSLIQRLLDSRTTPSEAGHSAMPSTSETVLLTQSDAFESWGNIYQGVAADDGYVNIFARAVNSTTSEIRALTSDMTFSSAQTGAEKDMACSAPVAKGQTYTIKGIQVKAIKIIFVKTLGAIGGGRNNIVRRALSCLRPSFNFSLKVSSKARNRGLAFRECRQLRRQSYPQQWTQHGERMLLQKTVMSFLVAELLNALCTTRLVQVLIMRVPRVSLEDLYRFGKAALCTISSKVRTAHQGSTLPHVSLSDLEKGGASC